MCDVPSIAVFCSESIECFPGIVSKFFFKLLITIPVAPIVTGTIVHFRFHIRCISIHKLLYFNFFSASFCTTFLSAGIAIIIIIISSSSSSAVYNPNRLDSGIIVLKYSIIGRMCPPPCVEDIIMQMFADCISPFVTPFPPCNASVPYNHNSGCYIPCVVTRRTRNYR